MRLINRNSFLALLVLTLIIVPNVSISNDYDQISGPCELSFPDDHGPHPGFRTEWWYYTGNLIDSNQRGFGFQLTFFRRQIKPTAARQDWPQPASPWRTDEIYLAHAALTDITNARHVKFEKMARPVLSIAGAEQQGKAWKVFIENWEAVILPDKHHLKANTDSFELTLTLIPNKPIVLHGENGYSRKGQATDKASCYYSFTRLEAKGSLLLDETRHSVTGTAWMDHEFSTAPLQPGIVGWDWFSLQLSDHSEIMIFLLRQADGSTNAASSGTYVLPSGQTQHLSIDDIQISPTGFWKSPHSKGRYPIKWKLSIPRLMCNVNITARVSDQEMLTPLSTGVTYWEGSVNAQGDKGGRSINGSGYVEMTGYARPLETNL